MKFAKNPFMGTLIKHFHVINLSTPSPTVLTPKSNRMDLKRWHTTALWLRTQIPVPVDLNSNLSMLLTSCLTDGKYLNLTGSHL